MAMRADAAGLVTAWYEAWDGRTGVRPTPREIAQAKRMIEEHGLDRMQRVVPVLVEIMRVSWPDARRWGAVTAYLDDALDELHRRDHAADRRREAEQRRQEEQVAYRAEQAAMRDQANATIRHVVGLAQHTKLPT